MPDKSLGQHWLKDRSILSAIADEAELTRGDTVLEIGPGLGTLTSELLRRSGSVIAVEFDRRLAANLPQQFPGTNLRVLNEDILHFDFSTLPLSYKVVANVPYYITSKIVEKLMTADNPPTIAVLLVQKEVAERIVARPGELSILAISAQIFAEVSLGVEVPAEFFTPPPKVDSQVVVLRVRPQPLVGSDEQPTFFRVVKAGFSAKRKKIRSSLAGGLGIGKSETLVLLETCGINPDLRAEAIPIEKWRQLARLVATR